MIIDNCHIDLTQPEKSRDLILTQLHKQGFCWSSGVELFSWDCSFAKSFTIEQGRVMCSGASAEQVVATCQNLYGGFPILTDVYLLDLLDLKKPKQPLLSEVLPL